MDPGDHRTKAFRASLGVHRSKDWLRCAPWQSLHTHVKDLLFRKWFRFYCQVHLYPPNTSCLRQACAPTFDVQGDHLITCKSGFWHSAYLRTRRYNVTTRLLPNDLRLAARQPVVEPRSLWDPSSSHPYNIAIDATGGHDFIDVTIVHPLATFRLRNSTTNSLAPLTQAAAPEMRQHPLFLSSANPGS